MTLAQVRRSRADADRRSNYKRRKADKRHFAPEWVKKHPGRVFTGGESITLERAHLKYVAGWAPYFPFTAGELARTYIDGLLAAKGVDRISAHFKMTDWDREALEIPAPLYFAPERGRDDRFVYVDIAACYFDLFAPWPLNVGFNHQTGAIGWPTPAIQIPPRDLDWLRSEKPLRHAMFGMFGARYLLWYQDGKHIEKETLGYYGAPELHALVKLSCHAIAQVAAKEFDCRMWLTDAGIFPEREGLLFQLWLADKWRLGSRPKGWGEGHLYAMGEYRIGRRGQAGYLETAHVRSGAPDLPGWSNLIPEPPRSLLAQRRALIG